VLCHARPQANYFCTYAYLYHQKQMLTDTSRMHAYRSAIMNNAAHLRGKVVLDVGTGTGVLAMWAAKAGARKVYAVEYTDMSKYAERLVQANKLEGIVTVIKTSVEELELPEKVDVIISEWMGYFLLRESMLDSVLVARDKHLKEDGIMMPSHATMYLAPITFEEDRSTKYNEYLGTLHEWEDFQNEMQNEFDINIACLTADFEQEQRHYYLLTSLWSELHPDHVKGTPQMIKHLDLKTCTLEVQETRSTQSLARSRGGRLIPGKTAPCWKNKLQDAKGVESARFCFADLNPAAPEEPACISGFAGWFSTDFRVGDGEAFWTSARSSL